MSWLSENYKWLFDGIGALALMAVIGYFAQRVLRRSWDHQKDTAALNAQGAKVTNSPVASGSNISQNINSPTLNVSLPTTDEDRSSWLAVILECQWPSLVHESRIPGPHTVRRRPWMLLLLLLAAAMMSLAPPKLLSAYEKDSQGFFSFEYLKNDIFITIELYGATDSSQTSAYVDTGASRSSVDNLQTRILHLIPETEPPTHVIGPSGTRREAPIVKLPKLKISNTEISFEHLKVVSNDIWTSVADKDVGALLGMDVLKEFVLVLDHPNGKMGLFHRHGKYKRAKLVGVMPIEFRYGLPTTTCQLSGVGQIPFILDTGSPHSGLVRGKQAEQLIFSGSTIRRYEADLAGGQYELEEGRVDSLQCGSMKWEKPLVAVPVKAINEELGLLGNLLFDKYLVEFDFPGQKVRFFSPVAR